MLNVRGIFSTDFVSFLVRFNPHRGAVSQRLGFAPPPPRTTTGPADALRSHPVQQPMMVQALGDTLHVAGGISGGGVLVLGDAVCVLSVLDVVLVVLGDAARWGV